MTFWIVLLFWVAFVATLTTAVVLTAVIKKGGIDKYLLIKEVQRTPGLWISVVFATMLLGSVVTLLSPWMGIVMVVTATYILLIVAGLNKAKLPSATPL